MKIGILAIVTILNVLFTKAQHNTIATDTITVTGKVKTAVTITLADLKAMKSVFLVALMILGLSSCKKNYTCECVTTENTGRRGFTTISTYNNSTTPYKEKMTKNQAEAACKHEEEAITSSYKNWRTENGTTADPDANASTSCNLK